MRLWSWSVLIGVCSIAGDAWAEAAPGALQVPAALKHGIVLLSPKHVWSLRVEPKHISADRWFDQAGRAHALAYQADGLKVDASMLSALAPLGAGATLGTTEVSQRVAMQGAVVTYGYGLSADLSLGGYFSYGKSESKISLGMSGGTVGWNPAFNASQPTSQTNYPFAPVGAGASEPLGVAGFERLLTDPVFGYAYDSIQSEEHSGLGELVFGFVWRFHHTDDQGLVLSGGWRQGVADEDRADDLFDVPLDDGSDDLMMQLEWYRELGYGLDARLLGKRTVQTTDTRTMRVANTGLLAPVSAREELKRDLSDQWDYEAELGYSWSTDWRTGILWRRWQKEVDVYVSRVGTDTSAMSEHTNREANQWRLSLSWSGMSAYLAGVIPMPVIVRLEVQDTYQARNAADMRETTLVTYMFF